MNILTRPSYLRSLKKFSAAENAEINAVIRLLPQAMGKPHIHSGLSIRKLSRVTFELRVGLRIRVLFARESGDLVLVFAGDHNEVRAWLKENLR